MAVKDCCVMEPVTATPDESVREVARRLDHRDVGSVVVVDGNGHPVGIVTDRDLAMRVLRRRRDPDATSVGEVMSEDVSSVRETAPLMRAMQRMRQDGIRHIPVTDDGGVLVGMLSWDDTLPVIAEELAAAAGVVRAQCPGVGGD